MPRSNNKLNRSTHGLVLVIDDTRDYIFSNTGSDKKATLHAEPKNILYIPKGSTYHLSDISPCNSISFNFTLTDDKHFEPFIYPADKLMPTFTELFNTAYRYWQRRPSGYIAKLNSLLYQVIYLMQNNYYPDYMPRRLADRIQNAVEYINLNYMDDTLTVADLAAQSDMSAVYFRELFTKLTGNPPSKYIKQLRIQRAIDLLQSDMYSVGEVARQTGFASEFYFSREFKRITGLTPTKYQNKDNERKDL
ncbi:MAG: helix-turn-helix transcriptional regulator [Clostridiales bacterium]|nr:helix-turn-helix transcriptional regulator [Clostridiales bacterium]